MSKMKRALVELLTPPCAPAVDVAVKYTIARRINPCLFLELFITIGIRGLNSILTKNSKLRIYIIIIYSVNNLLKTEVD